MSSWMGLSWICRTNPSFRTMKICKVTWKTPFVAAVPPDWPESCAQELVNTQDWEDVSGDLTKRYNRMRQHVHAVAPSASHEGSMLPASNRNVAPPEQAKASTSKQPVHGSKLESSLLTLAQKYATQLNLTPLYPTSGTATRKGGNERMITHKDKADRATNEQVMDPRTRLVLFKMIGRGLLSRVEGCVSTGKEVCPTA
jgi:RIO kinase 1